MRRWGRELPEWWRLSLTKAIWCRRTQWRPSEGDLLDWTELTARDSNTREVTAYWSTIWASSSEQKGLPKLQGLPTSEPVSHNTEEGFMTILTSVHVVTDYVKLLQRKKASQTPCSAVVPISILRWVNAISVSDETGPKMAGFTKSDHRYCRTHFLHRLRDSWMYSSRSSHCSHFHLLRTALHAIWISEGDEELNIFHVPL